MTNNTKLNHYYTEVQKYGNLPTQTHAKRWTTAVLQSLAPNLDRKTKKQLTNALPEELADTLSRTFWILHFRNTNITLYEFQDLVSKRSGNTDSHFAKIPVTAVFRGLKGLVNKEISNQVADSLAPELSELWQQV